MRIFSYFLILLFSIAWVQPSTAQKGKKNRGDIKSKEYYQNLGSDLERLHKLRIGAFVQYNTDTAGNIRPWYVNGKQDSVMLYTVAVGDPHKDGYWVYHHQFMSNLPDMPIYSAFEHIVPFGRDSFEGAFYKPPMDITLDDVLNNKKLFDDVDFSNLKEMEEHIYYRRDDYTKFSAYSKPYYQSRAKEEDGIQNVDFYKISEEHIRFFSVPTKGKVSKERIIEYERKTKLERYRTYLKRFYPEEIVIIAEMTNGKKRKRK